MWRPFVERTQRKHACRVPRAVGISSFYSLFLLGGREWLSFTPRITGGDLCKIPSLPPPPGDDGMGLRSCVRSCSLVRLEANPKSQSHPDAVLPAHWHSAFLGWQEG